MDDRKIKPGIYYFWSHSVKWAHPGLDALSIVVTA